jgi:hypothetical protein
MAMAYDKKQHETLMFGGTDILDRAATYRFSSNRWSGAGSLLYPGPRSLMVFLPDPTKNSLLVYGGIAPGGIAFNDIWRFENGQWSTVQTTGGPAACGYPAGVLDTDRKKLVIVCSGSETFEYANETWTLMTGDLKDRPPGRQFSSMAYDPIAKKTFLFGGFDGTNYLRDMYSWNGTVWAKASRKNPWPTTRMLSAMFYDPITHKTMVYGGIGRVDKDSRIVRYGDMWSFDGTSFTELKPATLPPARYGAQTAWDPVREKIVMFGGKDENEVYLNEFWEWDGTTWTKVNTTSTPDARMNGGLTWDAANQRLVYFGGYGGYYFSEAWALKNLQWTRIPIEGSGRSTVRPTMVPPPISGSIQRGISTEN